MGTSSDRTAGSRGAWTPLKRAATSYTRAASGGSGGGSGRAQRVLASHVPVLGGAGAAAASARAGRTGVQRLGGLLAGIGGPGLAPALHGLGLGDLVGRDRFDVLDRLVTLIGGDGGDLDSQAARDALCDVLEELFAEADSWEELEAVSVTPDEVRRLLEMFVARYVYNRVPVIAERLGRLTDPEAVRRADDEMRRLVEDLVAIRLPANPIVVDWSGPEGQAIAGETMRSVYETLSALDGDGT